MNNSLSLALATTAFVGLATAASAIQVPVDLSSWTAENRGLSNWVLQSGNDSVLQTVNGEPTVFFDGNNTAQGVALEGTIQVPNSLGDDDFIGFVLGYDAGELNGANSDFWLVDWKRGNQTFSGRFAPAGLALSQVSGDLSSSPNIDFWDHSGVVNEVQRGANLGATGWAPGVEYNFKLTFTANKIQVFVDDVLELDYSGSFGNGSFGFYNYSQGNVLYAGVTEESLPGVPLPATLPLLAAGFGLAGLMGRRKAR